MFDWDDVAEDMGGPSQTPVQVAAPVAAAPVYQAPVYESEEDEDEEVEDEDEGGLASLLCLDEDYKKKRSKPKPKKVVAAPAVTPAGEDRAALRSLRISELRQRCVKSGIKVPPNIVEKDELVNLLLGPPTLAAPAPAPAPPPPQPRAAAMPEPTRPPEPMRPAAEPEPRRPAQEDFQPPSRSSAGSGGARAEPERTAKPAPPRGSQATSSSSAAPRSSQKKAPPGKRAERMAAEVDKDDTRGGEKSAIQKSLKQQFQRMKAGKQNRFAEDIEEEERREEAERVAAAQREAEELRAQAEAAVGDAPGGYLITKKTLATVRADRGGGKVDELLPGQVVEVLEITECEGRVRARIADPPCWFTIVNHESGTRFAEKEGPRQRPKASSRKAQRSKFAAFSRANEGKFREESPDPEPAYEPPQPEPQPPAKPTPLHLAAKTGSLKKVMSVLQQPGANPNAGDAQGETPLFLAAASGSVDATAFLLLHSADPNKKSMNYVTAKDVAKPGPVRTLIELAQGNIEAGAMQSVLKLVDPLLRPQLTGMLQEKIQAKMMAEEQERRAGGGAAAAAPPPMPSAARAPAARAPMPAEEPGRPPRALAQEPAKAGSESSITRAAKSGNLKEVMRLLQGGADPNTADMAGETPLFEAAAHGFADITAALLVYRGDPERRSGTGLLAGDLTTDGSVRGLLAFFRGDDLSSEQLEFLLEGLGETMREIIGRMVRSLEASKRGLANGEAPEEAAAMMPPPRDRIIDTAHLSEAPLATAARAGDIEEVRMLLEVRADANTVDDLGETPLFEAVASGFNDVAALLLLHRADPCKRSDAGGVASDIAADLSGRLLLDFFKGAELSHEDKHAILTEGLSDPEVRDSIAGRFRARGMQEAYQHTLRKLRA